MLPLLAGVWLIALPYMGIIRHDALLYTVQALNRLNPDIYGLDVFFRYGSQDDYTVFPPLYAWAIRNLGIEQAAFLFTVVGKLAWFVALVWLARGLLSGAWIPVGIAFVVALSPFYDNDKIFSYGESFVTARLYAEAFGIFALGLAVRGRSVMAVAATLPALLLHPLVGLPVLMATGLLWVKRSQLQFAIVGGALIGAILLMLFSGESAPHSLFRRITPDWYAIIDGRTPQALLHNWTMPGWARIGWTSALWWAVYRYGDEYEKRLGQTLLLTLGSALLVAWLAGSVFQHELLAKLQLWRVMWVGQLLGLLVFAKVLPRLWAGGLFSRLQGGVLVTALLLTGAPQLILVLSGSFLIWRLQDKAPDWQPARWHHALIIALIVLAVTSKLGDISYWVDFVMLAPGRPVWIILLEEPVLLLSLIMLLVFWGRRSAPRLLAIFSFGVAVFLFGVASWEHDYGSNALVTRENIALAEKLKSKIPPTAVVFWQDGLAQTWLLLHRAHYASHRQNAGALIGAESALETSRRLDRLLHAGFRDGEPRKRDRILKKYREHTADDVLYLCADPSLDFVILNGEVALRNELEFTLRRAGLGGQEERPLVRGFVYQCDKLRNATGSP